MLKKVKSGVGCVGILIIGLTGCAQSPSPQDNTSDITSVTDIPKMIEPIVDRQTGSLVPGSARFAAKFYYVALLDEVVREERNSCMVDSGYAGALSEFRPPNEVYKVEVSFPPWLTEHAEVFAFFPPQPLADIVGNGVIPETFSQQDLEQRETESKKKEQEYLAFLSASETSEYKDAYAACDDNPDVKKWADTDIWDKQSGPWTDEFEADRADAFQDERLIPIKQDYVTCLRENQLEPEDADSTEFSQLFAVSGQSHGVIDEQQVRLAVQVAACKEQTQASERTMEVWASYEANTYLQYEAELLQAHEYVQEIQAELDQYLATRKN